MTAGSFEDLVAGWERRLTRLEARLDRARTFAVHMLAGGPTCIGSLRPRAEALGIELDLVRMYALEVEYEGKACLVLDEDGLAALTRYRSEASAS